MNPCCGPSANDRRDHASATQTVGAQTVGAQTEGAQTDLVAATESATPGEESSAPWTSERVALAGGLWEMGTDTPGYHADGEGPVHPVELSPFRLATRSVTNADFARFVDETGHRTEAEVFGSSFVFGGLLADDIGPTRGVAAAPWWRDVPGAYWRQPEGPSSSVADRLDHPVVHVSWNDAIAFCRWAGGRLPTEAEWEYAARGGRSGSSFPWGDELEPDGTHLMNVFQGEFPHTNTEADGWAGTSPVASYPPNGFGLFDMTGNVWEWCSDWFDAEWYRHSPVVDPTGPVGGHAKVMRGGSYLCHASYCRRYRVDARSSNTPDSSTGNIGFRLAF